MARRFGLNLLIGLAFVAALVLWILSITIEETFGFFNHNWAILVVAGTAGACFILRGLFGRGENVGKKFRIMFGSGLLIVAFLAIINEVAIENDLVVPIILLIVVLGLIIGMFAVGGKKWDHGDNQSVGYKNYHQRKAEEEKRLAAEAKDKSKEDDKARIERLEAAAEKFERAAEKLEQEADQARRMADDSKR
ncbi:MAG: hypothetical protein FWE03_06735 [Firmicutes bacterium]|nr:hypothetical protein [Bacillota bacterium]